MINFLILFSLLASNAWSLDQLDLHFSETEVHQGALVRGKLLIQPESINLPVQKLKGATINDTVYFQQLSPLLKKENSSSYESDIKVIFVKTPETDSVTGKIGDNEILLRIGGIKVIPVETSGQMLWADFTAPDFLTGNWKWVWISLLIILLATSAFFILNRISLKRQIAARRKNLLTEFKSCRTYDDVVSMWKRKRTYFQEFPQIEDHFRSFEEVLFRYQFKPTQTESEKQAVLDAYQKLLTETEGGLRGI